MTPHTFMSIQLPLMLHMVEVNAMLLHVDLLPIKSSLSGHALLSHEVSALLLVDLYVCL